MSCVDILLLHKYTMKMKEEKTSGELPLRNTQEVNVIPDQKNDNNHNIQKTESIIQFFLVVSVGFKLVSSFLSFSALLIWLLLLLLCKTAPHVQFKVPERFIATSMIVLKGMTPHHHGDPLMEANCFSVGLWIFKSQCQWEGLSHTHNTSDIPQKQISSLHLVNE